MKRCILCETESEAVEVVQVAPATWNGFHDFASVCTDCQGTRKFKLWTKPAGPIKLKRLAAAAAAAALAAPAPDPALPLAPSLQIAHRRTGALLHSVASDTLAGASLRSAALAGANLQRAGMRGADLLKADLQLADLKGADMRGADMRGVNLRGADLRGADFREARMQKADINHALYDDATRWPIGFDPKTAGAMLAARRA
jgi:hypothetical protein